MAMMISKFHKIIQSKIVWTAFAILISIAFVGVYTGSKSSGAKERSQRESEIAGRLYGEDISRAEFGAAYRNIYVMYSMMTGRAININDEIAQVLHKAAWQRIATLKKAAQMGLTVTPEQTVEMIRRQPIFRNQQTGQFDRNAYNAFIAGFLPRTGLNAKGLEVMFAENVLIDKAATMATQTALVTENEIKEAFHLYSDKLTVEYTSLPRSLAPAPAITEEDAKAYFDQNQEQFRMPEKAIVHYVQYAVADYTNSVAVTDEMVTGFYENNKQRYLKPAEPGAAEETEPEYQPLEEVKPSIVSFLTTALAQREAVNAADALVAQLADETTTFKQAAEKAGLKIVSNTPAFALNEPIKGIDPTAVSFARAAFALEKNASHYYSDPVAGREFVYVISLEKKLPSFLPAFDIVKADATESARIAESEKAYVEKCEAIHKEIEAALKGGTSFADAASKYNLDISTTVPFDATTSLEIEYGREIMLSTIRYDAGTLVDLIPTPSDFLMAYVAGKEPGDEAATLPAMRDELIAGIRQEKSARLAQEWQESLLEEANFEDLTAAQAENES